MIKLIVCLRRLPNLSRAEFLAYWRNVHAPLAVARAEALGIRRYVQVETGYEEVSSALAAARGTPEPYDGIDALYWDSIEAMLDSLSSPRGGQAASELFLDEINFIDFASSPIFVGEEVEIVAR